MRRILNILLLCLLAQPSLGQQLEQTQVQTRTLKWPRTFSAGAEESKFQILETKNGVFHYRTKHYRIESDSSLNPTLLKKFTRAIESVAIVLRQLPLSLSWPPTDKLPLVKICSTTERFQAEGGPQNSSGYYDGRLKRVLILKDQFFRTHQPSRLGVRPNFDILVHELTHLQMHGFLPRTEPWFYEGVAEYLATAHGLAGNFDFTTIESAIRKKIQSYQDPEGIESHLTNIAELIAHTPHTWNDEIIRSTGYELLEPYSASLLLVHYYFHGGETRQQEVRSYLEKARETTSARPIFPQLHDAKNAAKTQARLTNYWKPRGLKLKFTE